MPPGRPSIYGTPASERVEVRLTPAQREALQRAAEEQGTGIGAVIRELIDERVEDRRPFPGKKISTSWDDDGDA